MEAVIIDTARLLHFRNHGGKARATAESLVSNARHGIGDGHGGKAGTIIVFAKCFISTICTLNGRKVMT